MAFSLYCMVGCICIYTVICAYTIITGHDVGAVRFLALFSGGFFLGIVDYCYNKTINNLRKEIKELKDEIGKVTVK